MRTRIGLLAGLLLAGGAALAEVQYGDSHVIEMETDSLVTLKLADIDGDWDTDLLSVSSSGSALNSRIAWGENDGTGQFDRRDIPVSSSISYPTEVEPFDIDSDGQLELLGIGISHRILQLWKRSETSWTSTKVVGDFLSNWIGWFAVGDFDSKPGMDLVVQYLIGNVEGLSADLTLNPPWERAWILTDVVNRHLIASGDFDGDGWMDLATAGTSLSPAIYRNAGTGLHAFEPAVETPGGGAQQIIAFDSDGDGRDELFTSVGGAVNRIKLNDDMSVSSSERFVASPVGVMGTLVRCDFDDDLDTDLLFSYSRDGVTFLAVLENEGPPSFSFSPVVLTSADALRGYAAGDMDGDGDSDLVYSRGGNPTWLENITGVQYRLSDLSRDPEATFDYRGMSGFLEIGATNNGDTDTSATARVLQAPEWLHFEASSYSIPSIPTMGTASLVMPAIIAPDAACADPAFVTVELETAGMTPRRFKRRVVVGGFVERSLKVTEQAISPIPDADTLGVVRTLRIDSPAFPVISTVRLTADVEHEKRSDLRVTLTAPWGTRVQFGGQSTNASGTEARYSGTITEWYGRTANGDFTLQVSDWVAGNVGAVKSINLELEHNSFTCESGTRQLLLEKFLGYSATEEMPDPNADIAVDSSDLVYDLSVDARP